MKPVLANLGFLLQISGFFIIPSIIYAFYINELSAATGLLIAALVFLCLGFPLNVLSERKRLNLKQSCSLLILFFIIAPLINSIPYLYLGIFDGNILDQLLNGWFETSSAVSTTGLTLLEGVTLPKSLTLARAMSEWVGGIGITFILLSFFYSSRSLFHYGKVLGIDKITKDYKSSFILVLSIYVVYTLIFSVILILTGLDIFTAFHTTFTIYSTTGLTIVNVLNLPTAAIITVTAMMLVSALSFSLHLSLFKGNWKNLPVKETILYVAILLFFTLAFWYVSGLSPFRAFFHVVDFSSSVGLNLVNFEEIGEAGKIILVAVMLIGPCSFSVGGGIRILRLYIIGKALLALPKTLLTNESPKVKVEERYLDTPDLIIHLLIVFLFIAVSFFAALVLINYGYSFSDALVESVSAITTTGDSPKILTPSLHVIPKFLLGVLMLIGRIEILPIFIVPSRIAEKKDKRRGKS